MYVRTYIIDKYNCNTFFVNCLFSFYYSDYLCQEYKDKKGQILDPSTYVTETMKVLTYSTLSHLCRIYFNIIFCNMVFNLL